MRGHPLRTAWILLVFLALGVGLQFLGRSETTFNPSPYNFGPSGTSAFAELLRSYGYRVRIESSTRPRLQPDELAIVFLPKNPYEVPQPAANAPKYEAVLDQHLRAGGNLLVAAYPTDIASDPAPIEVEVGGRRLKIVADVIFDTTYRRQDEEIQNRKKRKRTGRSCFHARTG